MGGTQRDPCPCRSPERRDSQFLSCRVGLWCPPEQPRREGCQAGIRLRFSFGEVNRPIGILWKENEVRAPMGSTGCREPGYSLSVGIGAGIRDGGGLRPRRTSPARSIVQDGAFAAVRFYLSHALSNDATRKRTGPLRARITLPGSVRSAQAIPSSAMADGANKPMTNITTGSRFVVASASFAERPSRFFPCYLRPTVITV